MPTAQEDPEFIDWFSPKEADTDVDALSDEIVDTAVWVAAEGFRSEDGADPPPPPGHKLTQRMQEMRRLGRESRVPRRIWTKLLAAAELDDLRGHDNRIGMSLLYEAYCKHGNPFWIDPLAELQVITENLEKYQGEIRYLRSFIFLLVQLARENISPGAFLRYVLIPRMNYDYNYRSWRERNFWALERIAHGLIELRKTPPFDQTFLGSTRALVENVISKYVGKPLAKFRISELEQDDHLQSYFRSWQQLRFDSPFFLEFCRRNVFPFLYRLSGKVDMVQWVQIMRLVAQLERIIEQCVLPDAEPLREVLSKDGCSLYDRFEENMMERQRKGQRPFDMVRELKAFLQISSVLFASNNGAFLIPWVGSHLNTVKDPDLAVAMANMVAQIQDDGGVKKFQEHMLRFSRLPPTQRESFVEKVHAGGGRHPDIEPFDNPLGTPESLWPLDLDETESQIVSAAPFHSSWERPLPQQRPLSFTVLHAARQKVRLDMWRNAFAILAQGPSPPHDLLPALQAILDRRGEGAGNATPSEPLRKRAEYLARNVGYLNPSEVSLAALCGACVFGSIDPPTWIRLSGGVVLQILEEDAGKLVREYLVEDTSIDRPALKHYRDLIILLDQTLRRLHQNWSQVFRFVRDETSVLFQKFVGSERPLPSSIHGRLRNLWRLDELNLDRARLWDALSTSESHSVQTLGLFHFRGHDGKWKSLVRPKAGPPLLRAVWEEREGQQFLVSLQGSGALLLNWGQHDYLRLWARLRQLWERWVSATGVRARIDPGRWRWPSLGELPSAIATLEGRLGVQASVVRPGDAAKLLASLK